MRRAHMILFAILTAISFGAVAVMTPTPATAGGGGGEECVGDINGDNVVAANDLLILLSQFGACEDPCSGDLNGDDVVNTQDILMLVSNFGPCEGATACESSEDCDDGDPCTLDICFDGGCVHIDHPNPNCGDG